MRLISEKQDVQDALINHLIGIGWEYISPEDALNLRRGNLREPFLLPIAREKLVELNPGVVTDAKADDVVKQLKGVRASLEGNEEFLHYLRGHKTIYDEKEKRERNLILIDYDRPGKNRFSFTQEFTFQDRDERRADLLLFVNGFPIAVVENKSPTLEEAEIEAFDQVQRLYIERIPELLKFVQLFATCNGLKLHYAPTWSSDIDRALFRWKTGDGKDYGLENLAKTLFDRELVLHILRDYLIFFRADDQIQKYVLRPHQMRATEAIIRRVVAERKDSGLIWHTQGSGKSLTMIVAAHKLRRIPGLENPTILVVVDRLELETQMVQNLEAFGFPNVVRAQSKRHLQDLLARDYRGLIVTLIHKFDRIDKDLNSRHNIIVLVDEAHRSQEGELATYMRAALPNAFYFGFTGTPIDRGTIGRGTFETFGKHDPAGYLDKYSIDESIDDGTTVPLYYTLTPSELRLDREMLETEFFKVVEEAGIASIEELDKILEKADKLKAVLKADDRVNQIAAHIAQHYRQNVEPLGFKAFVVGVDREACALYKQALDRRLPEDYSKVVYTGDHRDSDLLRQFHLGEEEERQTRKSFRSPDQLPKMLIVTQKLLTGYDAPVLYCMYLDKPLKDHTLLQAIARVNRPYPTKTSGLIVDYVGVFEDLERALAFDAKTVTTGLIDIDLLKERFENLMAQARTMIQPVHPNEMEGRVERIVDYFFDIERREKYMRLFKEIEEAYEILSPDPFLRDHLDDYQLLVQVYLVLYSFFNPEAERKRVEREVLKKTERLIRESVELEYLVDTLPVYPINKDIGTLIEADNRSDRVKLANLHRSVIIYIEEHKELQPYLIPIGERVEEIIKQLRERQKSVEVALGEIARIAEEILASEREQEELGLEREEYTVFWVLRSHGVENAVERAREVCHVLEGHRGWAYNKQVQRSLRRQLYRGLLAGQPPKDVGKTVNMVESLLRMHRVMVP